MFARPHKEQEWFSIDTVAVAFPESVTSETVVTPRRVTRQKTSSRVKALRSIIKDMVALRADWNLFGASDDEQPRRPAPARRATSARDDLHRILNARRQGLQDWADRMSASRQAVRDAIEAEHNQLFAEDEALRGTLCFVDEADRPEPPSAAMQMSAHLISVALIAVALPLGVMALACSLLRGGDLRIAARMSTLTGFAVMAINHQAELLSVLAS